MPRDSVDRIREFLKELKKIVSSNGIYVVQREKNLKSLAVMGLTLQNVKEEVLALSVTDYCEGPIEDRDRRGFVWIFGKRILCHDVYMKLKIAAVGRRKGRIAKCISFHKAEFPLAFPFKDKEGKGNNEEHLPTLRERD